MIRLSYRPALTQTAAAAVIVISILCSFQDSWMDLRLVPQGFFFMSSMFFFFLILSSFF